MSINNNITPIALNGTPGEHAPTESDKSGEDPRAAMMEQITSTNTNNTDFARNLEERKTSIASSAVSALTPVGGNSIYAQLESIPYKKTSEGILTSTFVRLSDRPMAAVRIGPVRVPFYISSGQVAKAGITPGKWYPILGLGDKTGWLNKTDNMAFYYNSPKLREAAERLDRDVGDIRDDETIPAFETKKRVADFLNKDMLQIEPTDEGGAAHIEAMAQLIEDGVAPNANHGACCGSACVIL
ncbi:MAG: hypothetical protein ACR652_15795 [Methylocystis sp.]|uniref:hypothetical protein n=1 Tax=Methylocystis sp. TaxID=1911079 RepID=UPI003DA5EF00